MKKKKSNSTKQRQKLKNQQYENAINTGKARVIDNIMLSESKERERKIISDNQARRLAKYGHA